MATILKYPYKPRKTALVLGALIFAPCTALFVHNGMTNDRGLIIDGIIHLGVNGATIFYWVFAALSAGFVAVAVLSLLASLGKSLSIELTDQFLYAPRGIFAHEPLSIPLHEITEMKVQTVQSQRFLTIKYLGGKISIGQTMLPKNSDFDALCAALAAQQAQRQKT
jgi:hypothetical protein